MQNMTTNEFKTVSIVAGAATAFATANYAAEALSLDEFIAKIKSTDDKVRGPAWQGAATCGAPAIKPLAEVMTDPNPEIARAAKRAIEVIVRHAGRPGAKKEAQAAEKELVPLLKNNAAPVRREALWMLSEIASDDAVAPMAALLSDPEVREDARCALVRIPGRKATAALKSAFAKGPEDDFKYALADALRIRGEKVEGYPSRKMVPVKPTSVGQPKTS
jgi:HEAT repeat protein